MTGRKTRSNDWGFPRWRRYGATREAVAVRMCDRTGCGGAGEHPAPKAPDSRERWWFCREHVAEYNSNWDYFAASGAASGAASSASSGDTASGGYGGNRQWDQAYDVDGRTRAIQDALATLELEEGADFASIKSAYRCLAKRWHPDRPDGDVTRFQRVQAAYEFLSLTFVP